MNLCKYFLPILSLLLTPAVPAIAADGIDGVFTHLMPDDPSIVQAGEKVYQAHCAACHGVKLEGQADWRTRNEQGYLPAPPHDASGHTWHHSDDLLFEITKYGPNAVIADPDYRTTMPAYQGLLSDDEIVAVLSYIKNTWPEQEREWQDKVNNSALGGLQPLQEGDSGSLKELLKKYR